MKQLRQATLEGLKSSWDSPGLGQLHGEYCNPPSFGERFFFSGENVRDDLLTGIVRGIKMLPDGAIGFRTNRTTYVLRNIESKG